MRGRGVATRGVQSSSAAVVRPAANACWPLAIGSQGCASTHNHPAHSQNNPRVNVALPASQRRLRAAHSRQGGQRHRQDLQRQRAV